MTIDQLSYSVHDILNSSKDSSTAYSPGEAPIDLADLVADSQPT
jgi:hypothetical protein